MNHHAPHARAGRNWSLILCLAMLAALLSPFAAGAEGDAKTVRVGWYDSSFNTVDASGRRSGYAYEYQMKIAAYTGWNYEYVRGSWPELMRMLEAGEIDLMSDVSYTREREERMLFPSLPMGTEEYYLFIAPDNEDISQTDFSTLNGKRVGVNKGSIQREHFLEWEQRNGVETELVELTTTEDESLHMLRTGALDAYVTLDSFIPPEHAVPVCKIGASDFYFAVTKSRPDLLSDLNGALNRIQDENRYYNQQMYEKHIKRVGANTFLSPDEVSWLSGHGAIRVGYQDNYLSFCAADKDTGELTGILKDYLAYASDCTANAHLDFEATAYPTTAAALAALERGEVDCVFPANLSAYDGEVMNLVMTPAVISTDIYAVVHATGKSFIADKEHVIVAVNEGNNNYDAFLMDNFPSWRKVYYPTTPDCLKAVAQGVADCVLISNYRYNNISKLCEKYHLTTFTTGVEVEFCFAVARGQTELYSILAKATGMIPDSAVNAALSYYIAEDAKYSISDFVMDNLTVVIVVIAAVMLVILALLIMSMRSERKARRLISATEIDELTGLYNRNFFFQYANRMYRERPDAAMDAIVINIEQFHSVNALNGREFGDQVLRTLGGEIRAVSQGLGGIAGRFEADRFDIFCRHGGDYQAIYERLQGKLDGMSQNASIRMRMGVMPGRGRLEPEQLFDRARTACSMARGHYKEHLIVFDEKVREREMYEQRLLNDLRRAVDEYQFEVYYQPKYDIQSEPPRLVSAEALIRWRHPELGMISPDDFIPLFERNGQIGIVDKYVWTEAARQIVRWREQYGVTLPVSVNLSRVDVFDPALENTLDDILRFNGLKHDALKLEVTESAYTENADQVIRVVEGLRRKGYEVEMDDFGTGYSSLNMLSAMPIDVLKMDRAFIRNIEHSDKDKQLVALILDIARNLKIPVIAEGVETEEQMILLKNLGCELVQGYYFSRPLHPSEFENAYIRDMKADR
ncbi:MAG: EAL domain-containing protein [Clostridia bacterium]|nr:EAL domain-containing protein [Clostridia bacterium]